MEKFAKNTFSARMKSMLRVDMRRAFTSSLFYIMAGIALVVPILILVMTGMMDGTFSTHPQTGEQTIMEGFENVWQIIGSVSGAGMGATAEGGAGMSMDLVSMCNINMMYFAVAVFVCVFITDDFRSGYAKNLFTVRAQKWDYVLSKTVIGFLGGGTMILAFFIGSMIGGKIAGLPFSMDGFNGFNVFCSIACKVLLTLIFTSITVTMSCVGKQKTWLAMLLSLGAGMLLFTMAPMIAPLDASVLHVVLCLAGGVMFAFGLGAISNVVLKKTALV